jgi:hypothetical protein
MRQQSFCVLVVQSTLLSLITSQALLAYPLPDDGNNKQLHTQSNIQLVNRNYTPAQINYFLEIAFGSEFGSSNQQLRNGIGISKLRSMVLLLLKTLKLYRQSLTKSIP